MAWDGTRYIYIGDAGAVRRLDVTTNEVTTVAGQARWWTGNVDDVGTAAKFGTAWSVALDGQGGLYVSDFSNNTIRKIDLATRRVTTVAGQAGSSGFDNGKGTAATLLGPDRASPSTAPRSGSTSATATTTPSASTIRRRRRSRR